MWFFFFKQKTAYEMRISDWSSDVCSSDLALPQAQYEKVDRTPEDSPEIDVDPCPSPQTQGLHRGFERRRGWAAMLLQEGQAPRSEERRVGTECGVTCRSRWSPTH